MLPFELSACRTPLLLVQLWLSSASLVERRSQSATLPASLNCGQRCAVLATVAVGAFLLLANRSNFYFGGFGTLSSRRVQALHHCGRVQSRFGSAGGMLICSVPPFLKLEEETRALLGRLSCLLKDHEHG